MRVSLRFSAWALSLLAACASADHPDEEPAQRSSTSATLSASATSSPHPSATGTAAVSTTASQSSSVATDQAPVVAPCNGEDERLYGTTCCEVRGRGEKFPGMVYLACHGPQIGQACSSKKDCDIACSCDPQGLPMRDHAGPPDGTRGAKGVCSGVRAVGVWMCDIDEKGVVSHLIVD